MWKQKARDNHYFSGENFSGTSTILPENVVPCDSIVFGFPASQEYH